MADPNAPQNHNNHIQETKNGILHAYTINGNGTATDLYDDAIARAIKGKELAWIHLDMNHPGAREWLENELTYLDQIIIDALLAEETRPRILEFEEESC